MRAILRSRLSRRLTRYAVAVALTAVAIVLTAALNEATPRAPSAALFAAVLVVAWVAGLGPATTSSVLGAAALLYLREPAGSWYVNGHDALWMAEFLASVLTMAWLTTRVRRLEDERAVLLAREREARAHAETANAAKDEFLAIVSHEMKTPLTAILTWMRVIGRDDAHPEDRRRAVETIDRNARLQSKLIDDLLDVSRSVAGKLEVSLSDVDVSEVVRLAVRSHEPLAREANVGLADAIEPDVGVLGDRQRLEQVIGNLLSNALKFTPPGGRIRISVARGPAVARVVVADSGRGMEPTHLQRAFDRFWQGTPVRRRTGLGLGLAIVRHIVDEHGGHVWAESDGLGHGATFVVELPLNTSHPFRHLR
jgi:signal transduction histidine kinase